MNPMKTQHAPTVIFCPRTRYNKEDFRSVQFRDSPILVVDCPDNGSTDTYTRSLVWFNNVENKHTDWCRFCIRGFENTNGYYKGEDIIIVEPRRYWWRYPDSYKTHIAFHKECIEPMENNPYHPKHSLQILIFLNQVSTKVCYCCYRDQYYFYYCSICNFSICRDCATKPLLLTIDHKKRHEHTLSYFSREASMSCDVCGLDDRRYFIYVCHQCDFVVHKECIYSPQVIKISRHEHRVSFTSSFLPGERFCGVCREKFDGNYGGYSCVKGCYYVVHSKCATQEDVWDGIELEGIPEDAHEDITPFIEISDGIIQHFSHNHNMRLHKEIDKANEENKFCQACALPVYDGDIFSCMECDFVLHNVCAHLPLRKQHVMHLHPLVLQKDISGYFNCSACGRNCNGFGYMCERFPSCRFVLDVHCASISEPLDHQCHPHLLFLPSKHRSKRICSICQTDIAEHLDCGECDFALCFFCATLPKKFMYKHDEHPLMFSYEQDTMYWCDVCEEEIYPKKRIYMCNDCDIALHIECLLRDMYMLPGKAIIIGGLKYYILLNNHLTRSICGKCNKRCQNKLVYKRSDEAIRCSITCLFQMP